ncbi:hypothetical protein [Pedobacter aquatilis]|nr:hypothetical protein [Pedobacter aquatilis]
MYNKPLQKNHSFAFLWAIVIVMLLVFLSVVLGPDNYQSWLAQ